MKKMIGLALGSGGPRGLAHIGVIKALKENEIAVGAIAGTSTGSLMGGLYLSLGIEKVEEIFISLKLTELAVSFSDFGLRSGIIKGERLEKYLNGFINEVEIEDLPIPYVAVASDIQSGKLVRITSGNLTKAIRASSSLPGFLDIANINGKNLIDGGVIEPVPIESARMLGADKVIAVNLDAYSFAYDDFDVVRPGASKVGLAAIKLLRYSLAKEQCKQAEVVISPLVVEYAWMNLTRKDDRKMIIERGYEATMEKMTEIKALL
jgi:NTE family protein